MQTVTHDLRSPLTAIRGNAELILKDGNREATALHAEHIRQSAERMGALMENLLDYYRIDNGKETVRVKPFRLAGVAETLETEFAARMEEKRLEFRVNNAADEVVMGDRNLILRIGSNLLSNALKFTERGGVTLTALYAGGKFTLAVEDTGGGIDKDKREQIFKPFERLSNAATQDGFGLGLSIVKSLAELMEAAYRWRTYGTRAAASAWCCRCPRRRKPMRQTARQQRSGQDWADVRCCRWTTTASYWG